ncbi:hypothetical protein JW711_01850 [Candidatus Woesearchaeota archaeon]|nr:hypothetical protein [Candidatus Woesearchaeota archaeon]
MESHKMRFDPELTLETAVTDAEKMRCMVFGDDEALKSRFPNYDPNTCDEVPILISTPGLYNQKAMPTDSHASIYRVAEFAQSLNCIYVKHLCLVDYGGMKLFQGVGVRSLFINPSKALEVAMRGKQPFENMDQIPGNEFYRQLGITSKVLSNDPTPEDQDAQSLAQIAKP